MSVKAGAVGVGPGSSALTAGCLCQVTGRRDRQACKCWETAPGGSTGNNAGEGEHGFTCPTASEASPRWNSSITPTSGRSPCSVMLHPERTAGDGSVLVIPMHATPSAKNLHCSLSLPPQDAHFFNSFL